MHSSNILFFDSLTQRSTEMNIVIVGRDAGPGQAFLLIMAMLVQAGHTVKIFLGMGKPFPEDTLRGISTALEGADYLTLGNRLD